MGLKFETLALFLFFLFSPLQTAHLNSTCFQGFTGNNTGGSCFFDNTFCNWNNTNDGPGWKHKIQNGAGIVFDAKADYGVERAQLISPVMCEEPETDLCIQLQYKFNTSKDLFIFVKLHNESFVEHLLVLLNTSTEGRWLDSNIPFKSAGKFYILIEAIKLEKAAVTSTEYDIEIKSIVYRNTSCNINTLNSTMDTVSLSTESLTVKDSTSNLSQGQDVITNASEDINIDGVALGVAVVVFSATIFTIGFVIHRKKRRAVPKELNQEGHQQDTMIKNELYCAT